MNLQQYHDIKAWQCSDCIFFRTTEAGVLQHCTINMNTGEITWAVTDETPIP
jgi:hypothetical protein